MNENRDRQEIMRVLDKYVEALANADAAALAELFWGDDSRFSGVEDTAARPFGKEAFDKACDKLREGSGGDGGSKGGGKGKKGKGGGGWGFGRRARKERFYDTEVYMLAPGVAYAVSMRDEYEGERAAPGRVTLVFLKKGYEWRIVHAHFSRAHEASAEIAAARAAGAAAGVPDARA